MAHIHPTASVDPKAKLGEDVSIGPFCIIGPNVWIKDRTSLLSHVVISGHTTVGEDSCIYPFASIGMPPQDLKYQGEKTYVEIGSSVVIREHVTINSSCQEGTTVSVGSKSFLMAGVHVAHNCSIGQEVILANQVLLGGHVEIGDYAIVGGMTALHQYTRIGPYAFCGGMSRCDGDLPPFMIGAGAEFKVKGPNSTGLKRRQFSLERRVKIYQLFRTTYRQSKSLLDAVDLIEARFDPLDQDVELWLSFLKKSSIRGLAGYRQKNVS